jgi:cell division septation protein DedD
MSINIDSFVSELLVTHDCVIIPGFGGFLGAYQPAEMELATHTLYPPTKSIAFNASLRNNDGLLISHIAARTATSFEQTAQQVEIWVDQTRMLLDAREEIYLPRIGRLHLDIEHHIQFHADRSINYLRGTYGLRPVVAAPLLRVDQPIAHIDRAISSTQIISRHRGLATAAIMLLLISIGLMSSLAYRGVAIQPFALNTASILSLAEQVRPIPMRIPKPLVIPTHTLPDWQELPIADDQPIANTASPAVSETTPTPIARPAATPSHKVITEMNTAHTSKQYYVMVGAFAEQRHLDRAVASIQRQFSGEVIYKDTSPDKIRIGFYAGATRSEALAKLKEARKIDSTYWLLAK